MRAVSVKVIENAIYEGIVNITHKLSEDAKKALKKAYDSESSSLGKYVLNQIVKNYEVAQSERVPLCQDTGSIIIFMEIGQDVHFTDGFIHSAISKAISRASSDGYLRNSIVEDPLNRKNSGDNTPGFIHFEIARGERVKIHIMEKGAGAENVSMVKMLTPDKANKEAIKKEVLSWIKEKAAMACPPIVVGIGLGGTLDYAPLLAKKALLRKIGSKNKNEFYYKFEKELLASINKLGIGPQGVGGKITALDVFIEHTATHIASLPLAININCHSTRVIKIVI